MYYIYINPLCSVRVSLRIQITASHPTHPTTSNMKMLTLKEVLLKSYLDCLRQYYLWSVHISRSDTILLIVCTYFTRSSSVTLSKDNTLCPAVIPVNLCTSTRRDEAATFDRYSFKVLGSN